MDKKDKDKDIGLWRYGIISPLLHREANDLTLDEMLGELAGRTYIHPGGKHITYSEETFRKWLYRYKNDGLPALGDKVRKDKGSHTIPETIVDAMHLLRKEHLGWTLARILVQLCNDKLWNGRHPSKSALYRFAKENNLTRDPNLVQQARTRSFSYDAFGQLWIADFLHGPRLWIDTRKGKAYLHAIIDDATRYVVSAAFYPAENIEVLIQEMQIAIGRFGIPLRFYTDNGPCYASTHLKVVCARLGIHLIHTVPYRPQGRGKVERFFRTVRNQFLDDNEAKTLTQINESFQRWLSNYHQRLHDSLQCSPSNKRLSVENMCKTLPDVHDTSSLFRMKRCCRVYQDSTIRLYKQIFETPGCIPGTKVDVFYMPWDLSQVYYGDELKLARRIDKSANARRFEHPNQRDKKEKKQ